ncbi:hypothetical protein EJ110_NYTH22173 [Nymphaea thermarum]|nr:hypothetical protein EJ110_NYTH22173 [Nymphaea thermarum]
MTEPRSLLLLSDLLSTRFQHGSFKFPSVLKVCGGLHDVDKGRKVHGRIIKGGYEADCAVQTAVIRMYAVCGFTDGAYQMFVRMFQRDAISWGATMNAAAVVVDSVTMVGIAQACAGLGCLKQGGSVHGYIVRREIVITGPLENSFPDMYGKCGDLDCARKVFDKMSKKDIYAWTMMISCYNHCLCPIHALELSSRCNKSFSRVGSLREGKSVHGLIIRKGLDSEILWPGLIDMYVGCKGLSDCFKVVRCTQLKSVELWNSLITVYVRHGFPSEALALFYQMHRDDTSPDSFTLASSLAACADSSSYITGALIHSHVIKTGFLSNEFIQNSLIDMYCKSGFVDFSYTVFNGILEKSTTWNNMICGSAQNGHWIEAISLFDHMYLNNVALESVAFVSAVQASSWFSDEGELDSS